MCILTDVCIVVNAYTYTYLNLSTFTHPYLYVRSYLCMHLHLGFAWLSTKTSIRKQQPAESHVPTVVCICMPSGVIHNSIIEPYSLLLVLSGVLYICQYHKYTHSSSLGSSNRGYNHNLPEVSFIIKASSTIIHHHTLIKHPWASTNQSLTIS